MNRPLVDSLGRSVPESGNLPPDAFAGAAVASVVVDGEAAGQRIDNFLLRLLKGVPKSHVYRVLRRGEVRVNKGRVKADYRLARGDTVRIPPLRLPEPGRGERLPEGWLVRVAESILYEDDRLLVLNKPAGLAVHGGSGLAGGAIEILRQLRPGAELELVHRLDRETSGCLIVAKRRSTLRSLHALIREGTTDKRYLALLLGDLPSPETVVDAPLTKNVLKGGERVVEVDRRQGKPARTLFRRVRRLPFGERWATLTEAQLFTGRTHQIRVHAASLGAPIAGDPKYGDAEANRRLKTFGLGRLFLHAVSVGFRADHMTRPLRVSAPVPLELQRVLDALERGSESAPRGGGRP